MVNPEVKTNKNVFQLSNNLSEHITYDKFVETEKTVSSKIWYKENDDERAQPMYIQASGKIFRYDSQEGNKNDELIVMMDDISFFEEYDKLSLGLLKARGVGKKYGLNNGEFVSTYAVELYNNVKKNIVSFEVMKMTSSKKQNKIYTYFYVDDEENSQNTENAKDLGKVKDLLTENTNIKMIFRLDSLDINNTEKVISTKIVLYQVLIYNNLPIEFNLNKYGFSFINEKSNEIMEEEDQEVKNDDSSSDNNSENDDDSEKENNDVEDEEQIEVSENDSVVSNKSTRSNRSNASEEVQEEVQEEEVQSDDETKKEVKEVVDNDSDNNSYVDVSNFIKDMKSKRRVRRHRKN